MRYIWLYSFLYVYIAKLASSNVVQGTDKKMDWFFNLQVKKVIAPLLEKDDNDLSRKWRTYDN